MTHCSRSSLWVGVVDMSLRARIWNENFKWTPTHLTAIRINTLGKRKLATLLYYSLTSNEMCRMIEEDHLFRLPTLQEEPVSVFLPLFIPVVYTCFFSLSDTIFRCLSFFLVLRTTTKVVEPPILLTTGFPVRSSSRTLLCVLCFPGLRVIGVGPILLFSPPFIPSA